MYTVMYKLVKLENNAKFSYKASVSKNVLLSLILEDIYSKVITNDEVSYV